MKIKKYFLNTAALTLFLTGIISSPAFGADKKDLLTKPSLSIMVSDTDKAPTSGTFAFETKLFKLDYTADIDLTEIDARFEDIIEKELNRKGYTRATGTPDLLISYAAAMNATITSLDLNAAYAKDFPINLPKLKPEETMKYKQGALIVDFVDNKTKKLLWRGAIQAQVDKDVTQAAKEQRTRRAFKMLLDHFPAPIQK